MTVQCSTVMTKLCDRAQVCSCKCISGVAPSAGTAWASILPAEGEEMSHIVCEPAKGAAKAGQVVRIIPYKVGGEALPHISC
mmetsp:Transcript_2366/g.7615  ORF Transcript_2366/g.7615 Transcript_2366/m.7615 type:complete len:82 (-) Transcript_2366:3106-3351(-)|eukprot:scaffold65029_cov32-Tisochrysis_lutea.AAC.4